MERRLDRERFELAGIGGADGEHGGEGAGGDGANVAGFYPGVPIPFSQRELPPPHRRGSGVAWWFPVYSSSFTQKAIPDTIRTDSGLCRHKTGTWQCSE